VKHFIFLVSISDNSLIFVHQILKFACYCMRVEEINAKGVSYIFAPTCNFRLGPTYKLQMESL